MKISGIYKIESKIKPYRTYIGSTIYIINRWNLHLSQLRENKHHSLKLQRHYNKYGEKDLKFSILLKCKKEDLIKEEQYFIDSYKPYFNIVRIAGTNYGRECSKETRLKMSKSHKGRKISKSWRINLSKGHIGQLVSEETKSKMSFSAKGNKNALGSKRTKKEKLERSKNTMEWWRIRNQKNE